MTARERAFAVLGGLLTTVMGLAIKLEALDGPSAANRAREQHMRMDVIDPDR